MDWYSLAKISEFQEDTDILSALKFVTFSAWHAGTISWYSTGESPPIKAGRLEATPHLTTACKESNTIRETQEIFSEVWEKSAAVDSAEPNSKGILLRLGQDFVCASFLSTPRFRRRQDFVDANILLTPIFCQRQYIVNADIMSTPIILSKSVFCSR